MTMRFATATAALALFAGAAQADYSITILHTNDFHSRFEPISAYDSTCSEEDNANGDCFGGWARLVNAIEDAQERNDNTLLVDGGDQFQGTLFYTYYKGELAAEMMNALGYDGMTVGNHEFDDGPEVLQGFAQSIEFPILMSNADVSNEPLLDGVIEKSTVIEKNGERIGLIGLTPQDTDELASPGPNVTFSDPVAAVQAVRARTAGARVAGVAANEQDRTRGGGFGFAVDVRAEQLGDAVDGDAHAVGISARAGDVLDPDRRGVGAGRERQRVGGGVIGDRLRRRNRVESVVSHASLQSVSRGPQNAWPPSRGMERSWRSLPAPFHMDVAKVKTSPRNGYRMLRRYAISKSLVGCGSRTGVTCPPRLRRDLFYSSRRALSKVSVSGSRI